MADGGFKAALGIGEDWSGAVKACLDALGDLPARANLGLVYATDTLADDLGSVLTFLRQRTAIESWVGTVGFGTVSCGAEVYDRPAVAVLVGALPADAFRVFRVSSGAPSGLSVADAAWVERQGQIFGIVHGDPRNTEIAELIAATSEQTSGFLVGGLTGSRDTFPQVAGRVTDGGLSGALFGPGLQVVAGLTQGCTPIAAARTVTEAERDVIMSIDERPALEVFKEDIGELLAHDLRRVDGYIYAGFPIAGSDTGDYLVRNLTGFDLQRGWIAVGELVEAGQTLQFCRRDHDSAVQDLKRMLTDVKRRSGTAPRAGVYFSCVARGQNLFGSESEELRLVASELGEFPLVGFFANGEICNNRLYGYTGVLALFL